jgi:hypothetical protein
MAKGKMSEADFTRKTSWLAPKQCAGRRQYPADYIRRQFTEAVVTNTVQASTISDKF